jgi:hypothetical protein
VTPLVPLKADDQDTLGTAAERAREATPGTRAVEPTLRERSAAVTPPAAAPTIAVVHTFRSLLIASSNLLSPRNTPAPKPAAAPRTVQATRLPVDRDFVAGGDWAFPESANTGATDIKPTNINTKPVRSIKTSDIK